MSVRTFGPLSLEDLQELTRLSLEELERFTASAGIPPGKYRPYLGRLIAICLCQGAAQHYVDLQDVKDFDKEVLVNDEEIQEKGYEILPTGQVVSGVKDVDVVFFFEHYAPVSIPSRRHCLKAIEVKLPTLGRRRVDFLKKSVRPQITENAESRETSAIIRSYIKSTAHGRDYLGMKSVVGLYPADILGCSIWQTRRQAKQNNMKP